MIGGLRTKDQKRFYARMSRVPYKGDRLLRQAQLNRYGLNDWRQDEQLSTPDASVLVNPKTREVVTSFTGTPTALHIGSKIRQGFEIYYSQEGVPSYSPQAGPPRGNSPIGR